MRFILLFIIITLAGMALTEAQQQEPFWLVKIKAKCGKVINNCLGAIVTDNALVTTASCVNNCTKLKIAASEYSTERFGKKLKATEVISHPEYKIIGSMKVNDVALVKFSCPDFQLANVSVNDKCGIEMGVLSVIHTLSDEKVSISEASKADKSKKCKRLYEHWSSSQHMCVTASSCSDKSDGLIVDDKHKILYGLSMYASKCDDKNKSTIIVALDICKYYSWIVKKTKTG